MVLRVVVRDRRGGFLLEDLRGACVFGKGLEKGRGWAIESIELFVVHGGIEALSCWPTLEGRLKGVLH